MLLAGKLEIVEKPLDGFQWVLLGFPGVLGSLSSCFCRVSMDFRHCSWCRNSGMNSMIRN